MKYVVILISGFVFIGATASAQDSADSATNSSANTTQAPAEPTQDNAEEDEEKRSPYYKKVQGWLWIEGVVGPSSYDPDNFGSLGGGQNAPRVRGPEGGFSVGTPFGGGFFLGWFFRQANYGEYKLMKTGVEFQPTIRIPYVHIIFRVDLGFARMKGGNPYGLTNMDNGGIVASGGFGLRFPLVRWMSLFGTVDWSFVGLSMRGDLPGGTRASSWVLGQQFGGNFGLTFHFIGVRKN
ncbi:MAG: hypothetical protein WBN30_10895 [Polyangiales bacterium]